jgi:Uma2 family endonuclease
MVQSSNQRLTLEEFLALPEGDITYEFVNGEAVPKCKDDEMSPKFFHSSTTGALFILLSAWAQAKGRVVIEWAIKLTRNQQDWIPVAELTYISYHRLPADWLYAVKHNYLTFRMLWIEPAQFHRIPQTLSYSR